VRADSSLQAVGPSRWRDTHVRFSGTAPLVAVHRVRKFTDWGGDGMSMDELGNVYISNAEGVMAFDPNGNNILKIPTGSGATNNTFAGRDGKTLFITGPVDQVTAIRMNVRGARNWCRHCPPRNQKCLVKLVPTAPAVGG